MAEAENRSGSEEQRFNIIDLNYVSLYYEDFQGAIAFYEKVFGPPENVDEGGKIYGWRMGSTWLTLFPGKVGTY
jgi:catechol 2,3-dioxygenase-like lactoylglutathione lyase family enzyme